jgi:hypothetical protein
MLARQVQARLSAKATPTLSLYLAAHDKETKLAWMLLLQDLSLKLQSEAQAQTSADKACVEVPPSSTQALSAAQNVTHSKIDVLALQGRLIMMLDPPNDHVQQELTSKERIKPKNLVEVSNSFSKALLYFIRK